MRRFVEALDAGERDRRLGPSLGPLWAVVWPPGAGRASLDACCRQNSAFYADPGIEPRFRSKLEDYRASGFDRGHLAPAANHKASQEAMDATFCLSNVCPQTGAGFNRDYWVRAQRCTCSGRFAGAGVSPTEEPFGPHLGCRRALSASFRH